jgi:hypothetical protein
MNTTHFKQALLFTGIVVLFSNWGLPAHANTPRNSGGYSPGSEVIGGFSSSGSSSSSSASSASQAASQAIAALSQSGSFTFAMSGGNATVSFASPIASRSKASTVSKASTAKTRNCAGGGSTILKVSLPATDGPGTIRLTSAVANPRAAAQIGGVVAGVLQGLSSPKGAAESVKTAVSLASPIAQIEATHSGTTESSASSGSISNLTRLLVWSSKIAQSSQMQGASLSKAEVAEAIDANNNLVKSSSPTVLVMLAQQPEFQSIQTQITAARSRFKSQ